MVEATMEAIEGALASNRVAIARKVGVAGTTGGPSGEQATRAGVAEPKVSHTCALS